MKPTKRIMLMSSFLLAVACGDGTTQDTAVPAATPSGETSQEVGDYVVHFNAMTTDQLTPEVAKLHGIVRSKNRAMLNVSFVAKSSSDSVEGEVEVAAANLTGQTKTIKMRRVQEGDAVYYIGEVPVANRETLIFDIKATPEGSSETATMRFKRQFFTD